MSLVSIENIELLAAIERGDVQAVDEALQGGVLPNNEIHHPDSGYYWRKRPLLFFAAKVIVIVIELEWGFCLFSYLLLIESTIVWSKRRSCFVD